jgi:endo-1,4-beta-xylanase
LTDIVLDAGSAYTEIWKWVNMSMFNPGDGSLTFRVEKDNLTQTFQIGAREDGLDIDKLAFAPAGYYYTVENLDNGEEGSEEMSPGSTSDKPLADGRSKYVGCCYSSSTKNNFEKYWNQVVPENAGKWGSVEWARDNMNWSGLDEAYDFAKSHGFPFRFHVLVWGNQQPSWIETLSTSEQREEIEEWFQAVAGRYPDIDILEVVNEPLHDPPNQPGSGGGNYIDALGGTGSTGYDWIVEAFRLAREYFPASVKLMLNEYSLLNSSDNVREYKKIIDLLMAEELIDAVGMQGHAFSTYWASAATIKSNLDKLAETGLPLYVTEMDIDGPTDATQLNEYKKVFPVLWEHPAVKGITLWGFRTGMWRTDEKAYLINPDGTERPAMTWLREYIASAVSVPEWELASAYSVYPNPVAKGMVYIGNAQNVTAVKVIDISGRQLNVVHNAGLPVIAVEMNYRPGLYALQIESNGQTRVKKILVR